MDFPTLPKAAKSEGEGRGERSIHPLRLRMGVATSPGPVGMKFPLGPAEGVVTNYRARVLGRTSALQSKDVMDWATSGQAPVRDSAQLCLL